MEYNKANRRVCDVDIKDYKTGADFLLFDTANTTTQGISGDAVYAMAKGQKRIGWDEPPEGTMTIEAQVYPFKLFAMLSDGTIRTDAMYAAHEKVKATEAGKLTVAGTPYQDAVFVYANGNWGDTPIEGTYASGTFTAKTAGDIEVDKTYYVGYTVKRTEGVKRIPIGTNYETKDYIVTMSTLDKDENGTLIPFIMKAYKAHPNRNFELSQASAGDPATITMNFDLMEDKDGNFFDMIEDLTGIE